MANNEQPQVTPERLMQFGFAYAPPLIIGAAVSNKVFDTLTRGPKSVDEVSRETGASIRIPSAATPSASMKSRAGSKKRDSKTRELSKRRDRRH